MPAAEHVSEALARMIELASQLSPAQAPRMHLVPECGYESDASTGSEPSLRDMSGGESDVDDLHSSKATSQDEQRSSVTGFAQHAALSTTYSADSIQQAFLLDRDEPASPDRGDFRSLLSVEYTPSAARHPQAAKKTRRAARRAAAISCSERQHRLLLTLEEQAQLAELQRRDEGRRGLTRQARGFRAWRELVEERRCVRHT